MTNEDDSSAAAGVGGVDPKPTFDTHGTATSNSSSDEREHPPNATTEDKEKLQDDNSNKSHVVKLTIAGILVLLGVIAVIVILALNGEKRSSGGGIFGRGSSALENTETISPSTSRVPSDAPSTIPTMIPSDAPSTMPSLNPTSQPSTTPTDAPTSNPTPAPTATPTMEYIPVNPVPQNPPRGYFNYNIRDNKYGPNAWHRVDTSQHWLREFGPNGWGPWRGHISDENPTINICNGPDRKQSPKHLKTTMECDAHHEIRTAVSNVEVVAV